MRSMAKAGLPFAFDYSTYDGASGLFVRASIYDITLGAASFVSNTPMAEVAQGVYSATVSGAAAGTIYAVIKRVYTSNTYLTIDSDHPAPSTSVVEFQELAGSSSGGGGGSDSGDLFAFIIEEELLATATEEGLLVALLEC